MDFLDDIYLDNSVRRYLIVAVTILIALILKRYLSKYIASLFYSLLKKLIRNIDKQVFIDLVVQPLESAIVTIIAVLAIDKLNFPSALNGKIYHVNIQTIVENTGVALILVSLILLVLRFIDFVALVMQQKEESGKHVSDTQFIFFFKDFLKVVVGIIGVLLLLKFSFNAHIGELLTGLSIVGAALALAGKESLENLIASFIIFLDKPFVAGDLVKVQNFSGNVERIGLRSTRIRTTDKTLVTVPNKQMVDSILDNWSMRPQIRNEIKVELSPQTSSEKIEYALSEIKKIFVSKSDEIISFTVFLSDINRTGPLITSEFFTSPALSIAELNKLKEQINLTVKKMQEQNEIASSTTHTFTISEEKK